MAGAGGRKSLALPPAYLHPTAPCPLSTDKQDQVDVIVRISEGQPTLVAGIDLTGFDVLSPGEQRSLRDSLPLQVTRPLDRQLAVASRERPLNALRDQGYPYAEVDISQQGAGGNQVRVAFAATPGTLAHFGPVEIQGEKSVAENIIRRQLTSSCPRCRHS